MKGIRYEDDVQEVQCIDNLYDTPQCPNIPNINTVML